MPTIFRRAFDLNTTSGNCVAQYDFSGKGEALLGIVANGSYVPDKYHHAMLVTWHVKDKKLIEALETVKDRNKLERCEPQKSVMTHDGQPVYSIVLHFDPINPEYLEKKIQECIEMLKKRGLIKDDISLGQEQLGRQ
jgi:hypothetical protein